MYETEAEISELTVVLERSKSKSGEHVSSLFEQGEWLTGMQVAHHLQGVMAVALATLSSSGEPRVAPFEAVLFHGRFYVAVDENSNRVKHVANSPVASLTYTRDDDALIIVNGRATVIGREAPGFPALEAEWAKKYARNLWDEVVFIKLEPIHIVAFGLNPELFPSI